MPLIQTLGAFGDCEREYLCSGILLNGLHPRAGRHGKDRPPSAESESHWDHIILTIATAALAGVFLLLGLDS